MKRTLKTLGLCLILCLLLPTLAACGEGKAIVSIEDKSLSANVYEFMLSRMKGTLGYYGYDIENESFWKTIVSSDGVTYDDYFCATILSEATNYVIADYLFDKEGLTLSDGDIKAVDELLAAYVKRAGSKTALNAELKKYGVNYNMLRDIYILESKIAALKAHIFGEKGEKISSETKDKYLNDNYVCFKQIFLATYYYVTDLDRFGDTVYYTDEEHTAIAYDKANGVTRLDEFGKESRDKLGGVEYYTEDGKIAYDKVNGVVGYVKDKNGDHVIEYYSDEEQGKIYDKAKEYAETCDSDVATFEEYLSLYGEGESDGRIYLVRSAGYYAAQNDAVAYFDDMAEQLSKMKVGECAVFESDYGYHVLARYENQSGAYDEEENKDVFASFYEDMVSYLFEQTCEEYKPQVVIDPEVVDDSPRMRDVSANVLY